MTVRSTQWFGTNTVQVVFADDDGKLDEIMLGRDGEAELSVENKARTLAFSADAALFRLGMEARRIRLGHLYDPFLAVSASQIEPLPHQITAVYGEMLARQPLRFLLADDPGAGKTVMTGLFIKELLARADLKRCLIVAPGSLVEQWQDELLKKFNLRFALATSDSFAASATGNWFDENPLAIVRLDKLSRNDEARLLALSVDWDLIVCDEAHKMAATYYGDQVKTTKRYDLGRELSSHTRHFLLLTATPHNGKEADFGLFLALLDGDRFEGRPRDGAHIADPSDLIRRMVKEKLVKFDETPLFPPRYAVPVPFELTPAEEELYARVTDYVQEQFTIVDDLKDERKKGTVGFALTSLQRRLASSPEAIYRSLERRRKRLEGLLQEEETLARGRAHGEGSKRSLGGVETDLDPEDIDDLYADEPEEVESSVVVLASASRTLHELRAEIEILRELEALAARLRASGTDRKWDELRQLLDQQLELPEEDGTPRKLVIFTEHRDTLDYLMNRIANRLGRPEAVVAIHGGMGRDERRKSQNRFTHDADCQVLVATDAAGEGINLQCAHLMVNYDLPWNPNRLEQRFGRIHRIGQRQACYLWNLVAYQTREGSVYMRLLQKLQEESKALRGEVFDVLGQMTFGGDPLWKLLLEAVRQGQDPEFQERMWRKVDGGFDREEVLRLQRRGAITDDTMDLTDVREIRARMERAAALRLQPGYVRAFFEEAFGKLGGRLVEREEDRFEIPQVPAEVRHRDRAIGASDPVQQKYSRVTFEKDQVQPGNLSPAAFVCPGHALLEAVTDLTLERYVGLFKEGAIFVDPRDPGDAPRLVFALEHDVRDGTGRVLSTRAVFVEVDSAGAACPAGPAPFNDLEPVDAKAHALPAGLLDAPWLQGETDGAALGYAAMDLAPAHLGEVRTAREAAVARTRREVHARLTAEIMRLDNRANELRRKEEAGKANTNNPNLNSERFRRLHAEMRARMTERMARLDLERKVLSGAPRVVAGALVVPAGMLGPKADLLVAPTMPTDTRTNELLAMRAVEAAEEAMGNVVRDVSAEKVGYDLESRTPEGTLRFLEVKGRVVGADTVYVTANEHRVGRNLRGEYHLVLVRIDGSEALAPVYLADPFREDLPFTAVGVDLSIGRLFGGSE